MRPFAPPSFGNVSAKPLGGKAPSGTTTAKPATTGTPKGKGKGKSTGNDLGY